MNSYRTRSRRDRIVSASLAGAACVGLVAVIGTRSAEATTASVDSASVDAGSGQTSTQGFTKAQLDAYATQLADESAKLDAYRVRLANAGTQPTVTKKAVTKNAVTKKAVAQVRKPRPVAVSKPAPRPVAAPAPRAASHTKSS